MSCKAFFFTEISRHHLKIRKFYIHKHAYIHAHAKPSFQIPFKSGKILTDPGPAFLAAFSWRGGAPAPSILRRCLPQTPPFPITSHPACFTCYITAWPQEASEFGTPMGNLKLSFKPITCTPYTGSSVGPQGLPVGLADVPLQSRGPRLHCYRPHFTFGLSETSGKIHVASRDGSPAVSQKQGTHKAHWSPP